MDTVLSFRRGAVHPVGVWLPPFLVYLLDSIRGSRQVFMCQGYDMSNGKLNFPLQSHEGKSLSSPSNVNDPVPAADSS